MTARALLAAINDLFAVLGVAVALGLPLLVLVAGLNALRERWTR